MLLAEVSNNGSSNRPESSSGLITGEANFKMIGDKMSADASNDGIIDGVEGQNVYGSVLVPLDGDGGKE